MHCGCGRCTFGGCRSHRRLCLCCNYFGCNCCGSALFARTVDDICYSYVAETRCTSLRGHRVRHIRTVEASFLIPPTSHPAQVYDGPTCLLYAHSVSHQSLTVSETDVFWGFSKRTVETMGVFIFSPASILRAEARRERWFVVRLDGRQGHGLQMFPDSVA